jgi:adenine-specific DNA-methyltransferase
MILIDTMTIKPQELYKTEDLADALKVSLVTAKRYLSSEVVSSIKVGGSRRIRGSDILDLLERDIRKPKGGCELTYPNKKSVFSILGETHAATLKKLNTHGTGENKLISGDNLNILKTLYEDPDVRGKVDLIYIDPPFGTGQDFVGFNEDHSYSDKLVNTEFLEFLRMRLIFLRELLSESGSVYVHIDTKIGHYVKLILDEVLGEENFRNDLTRIKCNPKNFDRKAYGNIKDVIFFYSKAKPNGEDPMFWSDFRIPLSEEEIIKQFPKTDKKGRRYATTPLHAKGETKNGPTGKMWKDLMPPKGRHWRYNPKELTKLDSLGLIEWSSSGNPRKIIYADESRGKKIQDIWDFKDPGFENALYPTEKNLNLLEFIIQASSSKNALILDCFSGSGTTLMAAQKLGRRWIGIDANKSAIKLTEKRMLESKNERGLFSSPNSFSVFEAA